MVITNQRIIGVGANDYGQMGCSHHRNCKEKILEAVLPSKSTKFVDVSCSFFSTIFIDSNRNAFASGKNEVGNVGIDRRWESKGRILIPKKVQLNVPVKKAVVGCDYSLFLSFEGDVYLTGVYSRISRNEENNRSNRNKFVPTKLLANEKIMDIAGGFRHTLCCGSSGSLFVMGYNTSYDQVLTSEVRTGIANDLVKLKTKIISNERIVKVECGYSTSYAVSDGGKVFSFGANRYAQAGVENCPKVVTPVILHSNVDDIVSGGNHIFVFDVLGDVYCCGCQIYGGLGLGYIGKNAQKKLIKNENLCGIDKVIFKISIFSCILNDSKLFDTIIYTNA